MRDPYDVLGVSRTDTADAIKQAYRKLAKQYHPDLHPGDAAIETKFKEVSAAYDLLSDPAKRGRYDRGEIDASGTERPNSRFYRAYSNRTGGELQRGFGGFDADEIFEMFNQARRGTGPAGARGRSGSSGAEDGPTPRRRAAKGRGTDVSYTISVDFVAATSGTKRRLTLPDGRVLDIAIPAGTGDGSVLRLRGQGQPGSAGEADGDALIEVQVEPHAFFQRKDNDIHVDVPVALHEAIVGATITVPTIDGKVAVKVPRGSNTGTTLRLRGRGVANGRDGERGDQYVKLVVVLPDRLDAELIEFMEKWGSRHSYRVRAKLGIDD